VRTFSIAMALCLALAAAGCEPEPPMEAPPKPKPAPAPKFKLADLEGGQVALSDYAGKPLIVNFWATWCIPCIEEMPELEKFYHLKRGEGLELLMINVKESHVLVEKFIRRNNFSFTVALDEEGKATDEFQVFGLPCTFFIDKNGVILNRHMGRITKEILYAGYGDITGK